MGSVTGEVVVLQRKLSHEKEPAKIAAILKRLHFLSMTVEILAETGIGKTVNSLRKHEVAGEFARELVLKWKKLVPQEGCDQSTADGPQVQDLLPKCSKVGSKSALPTQLHGYKTSQEHKHSSSSKEGHHHSKHLYKADTSLDHSREERTAAKHNNGGMVDTYEDDEQIYGGDDLPTSSTALHANKSEKRKGGDSDNESYHSSSHSKSKRPKKKVKLKESSKKSNDEFENPLMSFESYLSYDQPQKRKKTKLHKNKMPVQHSKDKLDIPAVKHRDTTSRERSEKHVSPPIQTMSTDQESLRNISSSSRDPQKDRDEVLPTLPDMALPSIQPNYRPLPSSEFVDALQERKRASLGPQIPLSDDNEYGFTGKRLNRKMAVFSGSKSVFLPQMTSLYKQCIRVLQNNIDSIHEVGGVPFDILEPVLERCTPEQLYRIEDCNPHFVEDTDGLWMQNAKKDFRNDSREEFESWREFYLRKHDEREDRLRKITQSISSMHSGKPKGRQVKLAYVNTMAKPPRDIRRRQEKHGTGGFAPIHAAERPRLNRQEETVPALQIQAGAANSTPPPSTSHSSPITIVDKRQPKKIAPMMAKTIKAFKNRFSRR
uniref:elongin-A n=1 Tax=Myxine glutinosa TaxID=7769 RepID=UPI00359016F0